MQDQANLLKKVIETDPKVDMVDDVPVAPETPKRKRTYEEMNSPMKNKQGKYDFLYPQKKSFKTVRPICFLIFGLSNSGNFQIDIYALHVWLKLHIQNLDLLISKGY